MALRSKLWIGFGWTGAAPEGLSAGTNVFWANARPLQNRSVLAKRKIFMIPRLRMVRLCVGAEGRGAGRKTRMEKKYHGVRRDGTIRVDRPEKMTRRLKDLEVNGQIRFRVLADGGNQIAGIGDHFVGVLVE